MAIERTVIDLSKKNVPIDEAKRKEFRAKAAKILTRSDVANRLNVELPDGVYGEWIRDDAVSIAEARILGFELDTEYATKSALHTDSTGKAKIGDAVFMTMPKWQKEELDIMKAEQYAKQHGLRGNKLPEETQAIAGLQKETPGVNTSKTSNVNLSTISNSD